MSQKIALIAGNDNAYDSTSGTTLEDDLIALGVGSNIDRSRIMRAEFKLEETQKYCMCKLFVISLMSCFWPFYILMMPCIWYCIKKSTESWKGVVTDKQIVGKGGFYGCFCLCWNERTVSVPLNQITDLQLQQGCIQRCYGIKEIKIETASTRTENPGISVWGLKNPEEMRSMILKTREVNKQMVVDNDAKKLETLVSGQQETMIEVKDVLQDMRKSLVSMNNKMNT